ncbi:MAG: TonB-dependent receptor family protein [Chthoniobacterales bacterium]
MMTKVKANRNSGRQIFLQVLAGFGVWGLSATPALHGQVAANSPEIVVEGEAIPQPTQHDDAWRAKLDHILREVSGTEITVTKKATVIKLDQQPTVANNNLQQLFTKAPGLLITEQNTPGQFNFSYRGLGNPQESEFITALLDGVPLASDWIGFPTLYYVPVPQSLQEIQEIRGGSSLLYGPEPAPAVNFVTKHPAPGSPWNFYSEQIGGTDGLYQTYNSIQEAVGPVEFRLDGFYGRADGQRDNSAYDQWQSNLYVGYRPTEDQLVALDFHAGQFEGGDPGRLTIQQFNANENFSPAPFDRAWVDRYSAVLRDEWTFAEGWLMQAKGWFTHQDIDNRNQSVRGAPPFPATLQNDEFNNFGGDLRFRWNWGAGTALKGSTLTFGGTVYHGDAPLNRFSTFDLTADRFDTSGVHTLDQSRNSDYQAFFVENIFRFGKFHVVPSFRLDHESVQVDTTIGPTPGKRTADHTVPLWGIGLGNDFGHLNETYFSASSGWRPTRYFDVASPFQPLNAANTPDPFKSLDFELGVHGTPIKGLWYDFGLFWTEFDNRTETQSFTPTDFIIVNSGSTRHRGFEGEISYDFMELCHRDDVLVQAENDAKEAKDNDGPVTRATQSSFVGWHLNAFSNLQLLDATFTDSQIPGQVGNTPAYSPSVLVKGGVQLRKDNCFDLTFSAVYVSDEFWADSNLGTPTIPAKIPSYVVLNLNGNFRITKNVKLIAGINNLAGEKYYSRVFFNGSIEPAPQRSAYAGLSVEF